MKTRTVYYCTECGNEFPKWVGQCSYCKTWNTVVEQPAQKATSSSKSSQRTVYSPGKSKAKTLKQVEPTGEIRFSTGMGELDRVLGSGAVRGSLVLVGGAPGIGKSTLLLQICHTLCKENDVLYVSGEESEQQIKLRAERLKIKADSLYVLAETELDELLNAVNEIKPEVLIVDSIQTLYNGEQSGAPGSVSQVKACTMTLMQLAKGEGITVFVIGHVNKEGAIAGPKVLEHMVDCVLYFEGEQQMAYRLLRAAKNRFGSTNEVGVFEMHQTGLVEVPNPSEMLLSGRPEKTPGTCVACVMEGSRPLLAEVQALITGSGYNQPRRMTDGFDYNRAMLLMAVLEKRAGLNLTGCDAYINVIGGLTLDEPAADLPTVIAIASSFRDRAVKEGLTAVGEVGLTGELRAVTSLEQRLQEIKRLGFTSCVVPRQGSSRVNAPEGVKLIKVKNVREALDVSLE